MKFVRYVDPVPGQSARDLLIGILGQHSGNQKPITVSEMRARVRVLDAVEASGSEGVALEDADHKLLCELLEGAQFVSASKGLLATLDAVFRAETMPTVKAAES